MYYVDNLKRELIDTNAYKLQAAFNERVVVDGHGCHTAMHFGVKAKESQDKIPTLYWLPLLHKKLIKQDFLLILVLFTTTQLSKLLTSCLMAVKNTLLSTAKRYMKELIRIDYGQSKIQVKYKIKLKLEISTRPVCLHMIFLLFTLLNLII